MSKKIFESVIYQTNDNALDCARLYKDIIKQVEEDKKELNTEKLDRGHPLQHILNSTSGRYIAPTSMKSFNSCPAGYLYNKLVPEKIGSATSIGGSFHTIMERFYNLEPDERDPKLLLKIMEEVCEEDKQTDSINTLKTYVEGYLDSPDYLSGQGSILNNKIECANEVFIKPVINPLNVDLNVPLYLKIDRIDVRDEGIFVIDYKTGMGDPNPYLLGENGYLPQMIFYKWGVEAEYGQEINQALLCLPGASKEYRWIEMNVNSLVEQSKVIESVFNYLEYAKQIRAEEHFPEKIMRYCNSCALKYQCKTFIENRNLDNNLIQTEIPVHIEYDLNENE